MANIKRLLITGGAIFLLGLIVMFPARVAHHWFSPAEVRLAGINGSVWSGTASEATINGIYLSSLRWQLRPLSLFKGRIGYEISAKPVSGFLEANAAVSFLGTAYIDTLNTAAPLAALNGPLRLDDIAGDISLQLTDIRIESGWPTNVEGRVGLANLVVRALAPGAIGDFQAEIQTTDGVILGSVEDVRGMLELAGTLTLTTDRNYSLIGRVGTTASAVPSLTQQLSYLGTPDARGLREFRLEGAL